MSRRGDLVLAAASTLPVLFVRLLASMFGVAIRSRRSVSRFKRTLRKAGVEADLVRRLTSHYREETSPARMLRIVARSTRRKRSDF